MYPILYKSSKFEVFPKVTTKTGCGVLLFSNFPDFKYEIDTGSRFCFLSSSPMSSISVEVEGHERVLCLVVPAFGLQFGMGMFYYMHNFGSFGNVQPWR